MNAWNYFYLVEFFGKFNISFPISMIQAWHLNPSPVSITICLYKQDKLNFIKTNSRPRNQGESDNQSSHTTTGPLLLSDNLFVCFQGSIHRCQCWRRCSPTWHHHMAGMEWCRHQCREVGCCSQSCWKSWQEAISSSCK